MFTKSVDLFTKEEHVVISEWFGVEPLCDQRKLPSMSEALDKLGFVGQANARLEEEAAIASIVLERIQKRLPQWSAARSAISDSNETEVFFARQISERKAIRTIELMPQHVLTINWADSGPGFSWPVAYHVTWVPIYDQYVVTQSADSPDVDGYCDFAIGKFSVTKDFISETVRVIEADWQWLKDQCSQSRWAYLIGIGLIDENTAEVMANAVWEEEW